MKKIIRWFSCYIMHDHFWTSRAEQGIKPTKQQIDDGLAGYVDYAKMYCKNCGKESDLNKRLFQS